MLKSFKTSDLSFVGDNLDRPECIVATASGRIFTSDSQFAVREVFETQPSRPFGAPTDDSFLCNGFSLLPDGSFLVANLGSAGGVWKVAIDTAPQPVLLEVDGVALPPTNFVNAVSSAGHTTIWVSVSTKHVPRELAFQRDIADGFIVRKDRHGARVVADGIGFTNENKIHPDGRWLYVSETIARRLSRYKIMSNGDLGPRDTVFEFDNGVWPDGFEFDAEGGIWIASVVSNRLLRFYDGELSVVLDDSDQQAVDTAEVNFSKGLFGRDDIDAGRLGVLGNLASVSFGGADLKTIYLGSLFAKRLAMFRSPIAGAKPHHWHY